MHPVAELFVLMSEQQCRYPAAQPNEHTDQCCELRQRRHNSTDHFEFSSEFAIPRGYEDRASQRDGAAKYK